MSINEWVNNYYSKVSGLKDHTTRTDMLHSCSLFLHSFTTINFSSFIAKIMDFGDGHAAYSIKMSHAVGDGTTFFQIVSQISSYMNGRDPSPIDWNNPLKATHEIYPENFSKRDYNRSCEWNDFASHFILCFAADWM